MPPARAGLGAMPRSGNVGRLSCNLGMFGKNNRDVLGGNEILNSSIWWRSWETLAARADHRLCWARHYQEETGFRVCELWGEGLGKARGAGTPRLRAPCWPQRADHSWNLRGKGSIAVGVVPSAGPAGSTFGALQRRERLAGVGVVLGPRGGALRRSSQPASHQRGKKPGRGRALGWSRGPSAPDWGAHLGAVSCSAYLARFQVATGRVLRGTSCVPLPQDVAMT